MKKIRIAVMGCARIAERSVIPAIQLLPEFELVYVASRTMKKALAFSNKFHCRPVIGYEQLLNLTDYDAIYMPLPTGLHLKWGEKSLQKGKHVLFEKSFAPDLKAAENLLLQAKNKELIVKENYMFEYHAQQQVLRSIIREKVGEIRLMRASFGFPPLEPSNFRYSRKLGGGALLDAGGYVLKAICVCFPGAKSKVLSSLLFQQNSSEVDIWGSMMLSVSWQGQSFPAQLSFGFDNSYQCGVDIWGNKTRVFTNRTFTAPPDHAPCAMLEKDGKFEKILLPQDNHFTNLLKAFAASIKNHRWEQETNALYDQAKLIHEVRETSNLSHRERCMHK